MSFDWIYTGLGDALAAFRERRSRLTPLTDCPFERSLLEGEYAVLARQIATPNFESIRFLKMARDAGLSPMLMEYVSDKFSGENVSKLSYGIMEVEESELLSQIVICKVASYLGKPLEKVKTLWGQSFVDFHHEMLGAVPDFAGVPCLDLSDWCHRNGPAAKVYYQRYLSLFVSNAILFETFPDDDEVGPFTRGIVIPAIERIMAENGGLKPLIVPLDPDGDEGGPHWYRYPVSLEPLVLKKLGKTGPTMSVSLEGAR